MSNPSVFKILNFLSSSNSKWIPFHKLSDEYKSMSRKDRNESIFIVENKELQEFPFSNFVWSESRANLNIRCKIKGRINLDSHDKEKFKTDYLDSFIWRNYTIIRDGALNIKTLIVRMDNSEYTLFQLLMGNNLEKIDTDIYKIDLSNIDIIKEDDIDSFDLKETYSLVYSLLENKYKTKILKHNLNNVYISKESPSPLSYIYDRYGLGKDGSYSPTKDVESAENSDFYLVQQFEFQIKGFSAIPSAEKKNSKSVSQIKMNEMIDVCAIYKTREEIENRLNVLNIEKNIILSKLALLKIFLMNYMKNNDKQLIDSYTPSSDYPEMVIKTSNIKVYI